MARRIELMFGTEATLDLSYTVLKYNWGNSRNKGIIPSLSQTLHRQVLST